MTQTPKQKGTQMDKGERGKTSEDVMTVTKKKKNKLL
jgi:hypothetical protein